MQSPTIGNGETDVYGRVAIVTDTEKRVVHFFAENQHSTLPTLPESVEAPEDDLNWQFSAPYNREAALIPEGVAENFPELEQAFETLGTFVVTFPIEQMVDCMLQQLNKEGPYETTDALVRGYYQFDMDRGDFSAPELAAEDFNEMHVDGPLELSASAAGQLHIWLSDEHPEYDWFLPHQPTSTYLLTPLDN